MNNTNICNIKNVVNYLKQDESSLAHVADIIIKYEKKFFAEVKNFYDDVRSILYKLTASYAQNPEKQKISLYL
jgi:hypothetical protein